LALRDNVFGAFNRFVILSAAKDLLFAGGFDD
jgi:hypothetical protein